jgi:hypothetical protein
MASTLEIQIARLLVTKKVPTALEGRFERRNWKLNNRSTGSGIENANT